MIASIVDVAQLDEGRIAAGPQVLPRTGAGCHTGPHEAQAAQELHHGGKVAVQVRDADHPAVRRVRARVQRVRLSVDAEGVRSLLVAMGAQWADLHALDVAAASDVLKYFLAVADVSSESFEGKASESFEGNLFFKNSASLP
eukprot:CAMPEP_0198510408 /NCGR_PEP_ID=MMETSP1462-20131121/14162_1 /TAXON_ID=1333877 /ORGANISM="Brandtodinium nutriculum, Strain RCC3387" /LENGTH=141 /DNA_ID=CAMNT_0044239737 /DNA_START=64 /DNA_END=487 /DNA_ORIENTATION=+